MNQQTKELIKELSDKTWTIIADEELALGSAYEAPEHRQRREEIFAELIIKECASIAIDTDLEDVEGGDSDVLRAASTQIKQHFGVK